MKKSYFVIVVLFLGLCVASILVARIPIAAFLDVPTLVFAPGIAILMGFAGMRPREIGRSFRVAFLSTPADRAELERARVYFDSMLKYLALGGAVGIGIGFVAIVGLVRDAQRVAAGWAVAMLAVVYALVFITVVAVPFGAAVRRRLADLEG